MLSISSKTRLLSDRYWLDQWTLWCESLFCKCYKNVCIAAVPPPDSTKENGVYLMRAELQSTIGTHRGQNWLHHSAIKTMTFNLVSTGQLTCLHYHPGQQWDGAEQPTASSHLRLQHNQREHCSDAWQAAWPSPGIDHLQNKVFPSSALSTLQHLLPWAGICAAKKHTKCRAPSIIHWDRLPITPQM